jgi:Helix-turn-helix domain
MTAASAIAINATVMRVDPYLIDTLMRDLVAHSRSAAAFLVYVQLYRHTHGVGRDSVAMSHAVLAESIGLSKRSVQMAVAHLAERRLIRQRKVHPTAVPNYTILTPWVRKEKP